MKLISIHCYQQVRNGAGMKWLQSVWAPIKLIMNRWLNEIDSKKDGKIFMHYTCDLELTKD